MIAYLVNFTLCSALLLLTYHLLLKNKAMYRFNRFFLLFGLLFSLTAPLVSIKKDVAPLPSIRAVEPRFLIVSDDIIPPVYQHVRLPAEMPINYAPYIVIAIYGLVAFLLLLRSLMNLFAIRRMIANNKRANYQQAHLVLIDEQLIPHTFLNFIFLNGNAYRQGQIEKEVLQHELAHARQFHSADIIFIELLQAICWFNPFIFLYRKAIQLNHEFIADEAVLIGNQNINNYQMLLLAKVGQLQSLNITSQFNYSITKKRLIMMSKTTSAKIAWLSRLALVPVLIAAFMLFCIHTGAQQTEYPAKKTGKTKDTEAQQPMDTATKTGQTKPTGVGKLSRTVEYTKGGYLAIDRHYPSTRSGLNAEQMNEYISYEKKYAVKRMGQNTIITESEEDMLEKLFKQMNPQQQENRTISFRYPPVPLKANPASRHEFDNWKVASEYGVWVNEKRVKNSELKNYDPTKLVVFSFSRLTPLAVKGDGFHYQIELMTLSYYQVYRQIAIANRNNGIIVFHVSS